MNTLYFAPGSCALASHITLAESGLPYELKKLNTAGGEQRSDAYLEINPKGRVPALVTGKGVVTETVAILGYIAQAAPEANLAPLSDPFLFAKMQAFNAYMASTVHVAHAHGRRGYRWADQETSFEDMKNKLPQVMSDCFRLIEDGMLEGPYVLGEQYSTADPYLFLMSGWLKSDSVEIADFPRVHAHYRLMLERPAVQKALAEERAA
ncbi:glutathione S-transferase family protein [Aliirhizobium smilacinae]|uniref:Glutathione S-transferase family protein n=1 Tax=Aliirhizobium smilacinae TaxID=1395944 RepID=A0A5C4XR73_9HYPH|nr:glutathione S-transferase family protein [Rhizobium smilacinae]TNM65789.1 glutathione S-transferase family protein [Rhizobium smilacinae]